MDEAQQHAAKPGTACLGCRRRKLKCSREEQGCTHCLKADLPCVYPAPKTGVKRKRGPYKKDKPAREKHLEDLVKYLEPKTAGSETGFRVASTTADPSTTSQERTPGDGLISDAGSSTVLAPTQPPAGNAEDLVKDALIALTRSSNGDNDNETLAENGITYSGPQRHLDAGGPGSSQPSARRIFEYWDIFVYRIDPLLKILHCPSFAKNLYTAIDEPHRLELPTETLLYSIYYTVISTCGSREVMRRFGESRNALLQRYAKTIEANLSDNYSIPTLESVQALVLYLTPIRRSEGNLCVRALFSLAVRMAQLISLHEDPGDKYPPFEAEMRRRLWWLLCSLEARVADEGVHRQTSIMEGRSVLIPTNLNDGDIHPFIKEVPAPRTGIADVAFLVLRSELFTCAHKLWVIKKRFAKEGRLADTDAMASEQRAAVSAFARRATRDVINFCHSSRRLDCLCLEFFRGIQVKLDMMIEHPLGLTPTKEMSLAQRHRLFQQSVQVIATTHGLTRCEKLGDWSWYFRGFMQWHAVGVVIAELVRSGNSQFSSGAWAVLEPILGMWNETYESKKGELAWDSVNALIEKARGAWKANEGKAMRQGSTGGVGAQQQQPQSQLQNAISAHPLPVQQSTAPPFPPQGANLPARHLSTAMCFEPDIMLPQVPPADSSMDQMMYPMHENNNTMAGGFEGLSGSEFEGWDNIDFSAFDMVFGDPTWDSSPSMDAFWNEGVVDDLL